MCPPACLPPPLLSLLSLLSLLPPPQRSHRNDQRLTPMLEGGEGEEWEVRGSEEVTWTTAASQLIERPLGG